VRNVYGSCSPNWRDGYLPWSRSKGWNGYADFSLSWWQTNHPDWLEYGADHKTVLTNQGDASNFCIDYTNPELQKYIVNQWIIPDLKSGAVVGVFAGVPAATNYGNAGVGILRGPSQANFNFSVAKDTRITENQKIQFRAEFFNIFNHTNFNNPAATLGNPGFGVITSAAAPREAQLALKLTF